MPALPVWTATLGAADGPAAASTVPCDACAATGRQIAGNPCITCRDASNNGRPIRRPRHGCRCCTTCDGQKTRRARRGEEPWDAYQNMPLETAKQAAQRERAEHGNSRSTRPAVTEPGSGGYRWERAKAAQYRNGSYADLDRALARLESENPSRHHLLVEWARHHDSHTFAFTADALITIRETVAVLATRIPRPVRVPSYARRAAKPL